jgi:hypothetical protein
MLRSLKALEGDMLNAMDGTIGSVHDFLFDDQSWVVRYLVADTGTWLPGRQVLIPGAILGEPTSWGDSAIPVPLTRDQIEDSPGIELDAPVSRRRERELHEHYRLRTYWTEPMDPAGAHSPYEPVAGTGSPTAQPEDESACHLRSTTAVRGYAIHALDGDIGHVEEFVAETPGWIIRYMVVDTRNWLPGRKVLVSPTWITDISWAERAVRVDLPRDLVKDAPEYDPSAPVNRRYEEQLYDFYGRPRYWS